MTDLRGKRVLITGAAHGIGANSARRLAAAGAALSLLDIDGRGAAALAHELGSVALAIEADVTEFQAMEGAVAQTLEHLGGLDVVIANAGVGPFGCFQRSTPEEFERTIRVNLFGVANTLRAALEPIRAQRGYMLAIASIAASVQLPMMSAYAASKAGVHALVSCLRGELAGSGAAVGTAYFSYVETTMYRSAYESAEAARLRDCFGLNDSLYRAVPITEAARTVERAVAHRARRVVLPRALAPLIVAPGVFQPFIDAWCRHRKVGALVEELAAEAFR